MIKAKLTLWCNGDNLCLIALLVLTVDCSDSEIVLHSCLQTITGVVATICDTGIIGTCPVLRPDAIFLYSIVCGEGRVKVYYEPDRVVVEVAAAALYLEPVRGLWGWSCRYENK